MKQLSVALAAMATAAAALVATPAVAADELDLAKAKNCLSCHAVDKKVVGPSYEDVAAKFADKSDAVDYLADRIINGSQGTWGAIPMPPNGNVNEEEAKKLATWIMEMK